MRVPQRHELLLVLPLVAPKQQQVGDAEELQVDQLVLRLALGEAAANHVRHHRDAVFVLYGGSHGHRAGPVALGHALVQPALRLAEHHLAAVRGDVDVLRVELTQGVDGAVHRLDAVALQRRQQFERERRRPRVAYSVYYTHVAFAFPRGRAQTGLPSRLSNGKDNGIGLKTQPFPPACAQMFSRLCADVFLFLRGCFPERAHNFYCPQLWVVQPTVMGRTTHSYGLYNPQLWAVEFMSISWKSPAYARGNTCPPVPETARTFPQPHLLCFITNS